MRARVLARAWNRGEIDPDGPDSPDAMLTDRAKDWNTSKSPGAITLGALAPIAEKDCGSN